MDNAQVAENACGAICNLAANSTANEAALGSDGYDAVVRALRAHMDNAQVAENACGAIRNLAANTANKAALGSDGCDAVVRALRAHMDNAQVAKQACGAICNLAFNSTANKAVLNGNMELRGALLLCKARYPDEQAMTNLSSRTIS
jgi:hypothetical protein